MLTLGLGVGIVTTVFGLLHAALFRPLPFQDPERLVMLYLTERVQGREDRMRWPYAGLRVLREASRTMDVASFTSNELNLSGLNGDPERVSAELVASDYFGVLRVHPSVGRSFRAVPEVPGQPAEVVVSDAFWRGRFPDRDDAIDAKVLLNGQPLAIVGVAPPGFLGLTGGADIWLPETMAPALTYREYLTSPQYFHNAIARLREGQSIATAEAELRLIASQIASVAPPRTEGASARSATVVALGEARHDGQAVRARWLLFAAAGLVLLLASVNVASLCATRMAGRDREAAVRLALGCGRGRLLGLLATEMLLVGGGGLVVGLLVFIWATSLVRAIVPPSIATPANDYMQLAAFAAPGFEAANTLFAATAALVSTLVIVLLVGTAWVGRDLTVLQTSRGISSLPSSRAARVLDRLVIAQVALAVALLVGSGVMLRTLASLRGIDPGFRSDGVAIFSVDSSTVVERRERGPELVSHLLERIARVPGVSGITVGQCTPFSSRCARLPLEIIGSASLDQAAPNVGWHRVGPDHFRTLDIAVREGRGFTNADRLGRPAVVVVSETAARHFWPTQSPLGQRVRLPEPLAGEQASIAEVVGIVDDVMYWPPDEPTGSDVYQPALQFSHPWTTVMARVVGDPQSYTEIFRRAVAEVEPGLPIFNVGTLDDLASRGRAERWFLSALLSAFAGVALFLAAIGVYGVTAEWQARRWKELGVRLALGAEPRQIMGLVLRRTLARVTLGLAFGLVISAALGRLLEIFLYQVRPSDPAVLAGAGLAMLGVAICAAYLPARSILRFDPARELGAE